MDLKSRCFEERFKKIVEHLDALGIDVHRRRNGNRRLAVELAHDNPINVFLSLSEDNLSMMMTQRKKMILNQIGLVNINHMKAGSKKYVWEC